jgi:tight adherence protein B
MVLKKRLRRMAMRGDDAAIPEELKSEIIREIPPFERLLAKLPLIGNIDRNLDQAGLKTTPTQFALYTLLSMVLGFCAGYVVMKSLLFACAVPIAVVLAVVVLLGQLKRRREEKFTEQMPDVLAMLSRSLRAGHSMNSAIELVGKEVADPAGELFKIAYEQQKLGLRILDTLANMTLRIESLDLRFFVTSISIHSEVGGNLAEVLDKLAETIRERLKIKRQVRVITAQGRLSGYVLGALPMVVFLGMTVLLPGYEEQLFKEKLGNYMLAGALSLQIIGFIVIRKIINIRI